MNRWRIFVGLSALLALAWILLMPLVARRASFETFLAPFPLPRPPFPHGPWSGAERSGVGSLVGNLATLVRDFLAGSLVLFLLPERMRAMTTKIEAVLAEGQEKGDFRRDVPASTLFAAMEGFSNAIIYTWLNSAGQANP